MCAIPQYSYDTIISTLIECHLHICTILLIKSTYTNNFFNLYFIITTGAIKK